MTFPKDFIWGAATASYQIEGAAKEDGRQESVWDAFSHTPGKTKFGATGDIACDHYHRYKEDIELFSQLGIPNYRFSVAWPRVLSYDSDTKGGAIHGIVNQKGLDFYDRLIDALLEKNITPWLTLFHWDLPLVLERKGGWRNRDVRYWAGEYTELIVKKFGDRVKNFFTLNEMPCILGGYMGWMAPGLELSRRELLNTVHNILLTQGTMVQAVRANASEGTKVGLAHCGFANFPATDSAEDIAAFEKSMDVFESAPESWHLQKGSGILYGGSLHYWCDPIYFGTYPKDADKVFGADMPEILDGDMKIISSPVDFHGQNIYEGIAICAPTSEKDKEQGFSVKEFPYGYPTTAAKWNITPRSMHHFTKHIYDRYKKPVIISENGLSTSDYISPDGKIHDTLRIDFTNAYLNELGKSIQDGADIRGYFHWSILDNFEWARGYTERFGLVHVDYETQKRTPKDSAYWFRDVIKNNGTL